MSLFIKKIIIVLLVGLAISIVLDFLISSKLKKSDSFAFGESFIWNEIYKGNMNEELLIYGSSRAWVHFDPQIIQDSLGLPAYNLGIDGHNFWLQYLRHIKLLKYNNKPKIIILSVGIFSLNKRKDLYNLDQFLPFIFDWDVYKYTSSYNGLSILDYTIPLYRYSGKQDAIKKSLNDLKKEANKEPYRLKGFKGRDRIWNQDLANAKLKMDTYELKKHEPSENLMQQFLEECRDLGIKVVIVYSPEQVEGQDFVNNRDEIINTYASMAKKNGFAFIDYSNDAICRDKNLFYNSMHLNAKGARIFTNKLVLDLKKMNLIDRNSL